MSEIKSKLTVTGVVALALMVALTGTALAAATTLQTLDTSTEYQNNESSVTGTVNYTSPGLQITEGGMYTSSVFTLSESPDSLEYDVDAAPAAVSIRALDGTGTEIGSKSVSSAGTGSIDLSSSTATDVQVEISVMDDGDGTADETSSIAFTNLNAANDAPTADFVDDDNSRTITVGTDVTLDASASSDPDDGDTLSYEWDLDNDGTFDDATSSTAVVNKSATGTYEVSVKVLDGNGGTDTATMTLDVQDSSSSGTSTSSTDIPWTLVGGAVVVIGGLYFLFKEDE